MNSVSRISVLTMLFLCLASNANAAPQLVYLSCDLPATDPRPANHFDFTLDEQNSTVSFYVKKAGVVNNEKAIFGPQTVIWTNQTDLSTLTRTISRINLSFTEDMELVGSQRTHQVGKCSIVQTPERQF